MIKLLSALLTITLGYYAYGQVIQGGGNSGVGTGFSGGAANCILFNSSSVIGCNSGLTYNGVNTFSLGTSIAFNSGGSLGVENTSSGLFSWSSGASALTSTDTGLGRSAAGVVEVDNGTLGAFQDIKARSYVTAGAVPTTLGSCSFGTLVGGNTAGTFVAQGCGPPATAATAMVLVLAAAAPNGWSCDASDRTSNLASGATVQALTQNASTVTAVSFRASTLTSDVIQWKCLAY